MPMAPAPTEESVTNTPSRSPAKVVSVAVHRGSGHACRVAVQQTQPPVRQDADRGRDQGRRGVALDAQDMEREERQDCCRDAAGSEPAGDAPVHRPFEPVRQRAVGLGYRRVEEVGPDSGRRVHLAAVPGRRLAAP